MALHTEGEARARFAAAISAEHFAAVAQARLRGEATNVDGSAADDELLGRAYRLLARDEHNMWRLLERHLRFAGGGAEAWMCEVLAWLEGMADTPDAAPSRCAWDRTAGMPGRGGALDPDAAARHECTVHPDDREAEDRFLRALWGYIRAGQLERAQKHCRSSQQWWRAASLSPAAEHGERGLSRSAWRAACRELARDAGAPAFERAIYAVLSADGDTLQAFRSASEDGIQGVLSSWYDKLFVWVKVCVDAREDLVAQGGEAKPSCDATQESLALFLQSCSVATAEDVLAGAVADSVGSENAAVAETWINGAIHFYRGVQELLIFGGHRELPLSRIWGVLPTGLRWPSRLSADRARLPTDIQQLGDDLSSQVTRSALHAGVLLSQSGPEGTTEVSALAAGELEALCREYVQLLAASLEDEASESLSLVAGYTNWLPQRSQGDTLVEVLKGMPALAWQEVLANAAVQPAVVADVQYRVVQSILCGPSTDDDKLVALRWACSHIVDDGHDGLFMRMQGLRQVNSFLRARLLDEGMDGLSSEPPCALLDAGKVLCGAEMSDLFERICEAFPSSTEEYNSWLRASPPPVAHVQELADVSYGSSQDDLREYRCWQVLLNGQVLANELVSLMATPLSGETLAVDTRQRQSYDRTVVALYELVSFERRWMLDISCSTSARTSAGHLQRTREMESIRKLCVPHACLQLMHYLQAFGDYQKCVDLVEIVAREDSPLFSDFEPTALHKLLASVPAVCISTAAQDNGDAPRQDLCNVLLG